MLEQDSGMRRVRWALGALPDRGKVVSQASDLETRRTFNRSDKSCSLRPLIAQDRPDSSPSDHNKTFRTRSSRETTAISPSRNTLHLASTRHPCPLPPTLSARSTRTTPTRALASSCSTISRLLHPLALPDRVRSPPPTCRLHPLASSSPTVGTLETVYSRSRVASGKS